MMAVGFRRDKLSYLTNNSYVRTCNIVRNTMKHSNQIAIEA